MTELVESAARLCALLGLLCAVAVWLRTRSLGQSLPVLLEFLLAAGLLRLSYATTWRAIATAAVVVLLRKLVAVYGVRPAQRSAA